MRGGIYIYLGEEVLFLEIGRGEFWVENYTVFDSGIYIFSLRYFLWSGLYIGEVVG